MFTQAFLFACTAAALVSICHSVQTTLLPSPCPELFTYESVNNEGYWTGSLILRPDYDLRGIYVRLIFNKDVKDVTVDNEFIIKDYKGDKKQVKIQSPDLYVAADETKILNINITYEGSEIPSLIEYRLNARPICPQININIDVFEGDSKSDLLDSLQVKHQMIPPSYDCGIPYPSNQYPWQAAVYLHVDQVDVYTCDAILIDPSYLITSAHCVTVKNDSMAVPRSIVTVRFGQDGSNKNAFRSFVREIIVHPGYEFGYLGDDIAVLRLVNPVDVTKEFRPICLGSEYNADDKITISGYELIKDGQVGKVIDSEVSRVDLMKCITDSPNFDNLLTYDTFCVSYKSVDKFCVGNSGSGLFSTSKGKTTLRGLVSLSARLQKKSNCDDKTNIIITDIERYLSFIDNILD